MTGVSAAPIAAIPLSDGAALGIATGGVAGANHQPSITSATIALSGTYGQILSYVVSVDFIFFGLTGAALFVFRRRFPDQPVFFKAPLHPVTTGLFVAACAVVVVATVWTSPVNSLIGYTILLAGVPACLYWQSKNRGARA
jgi:APA family basic amino acid/polyamine antiporter